MNAEQDILGYVVRFRIVVRHHDHRMLDVWVLHHEAEYTETRAASSEEEAREVATKSVKAAFRGLIGGMISVETAWKVLHR